MKNQNNIQVLTKVKRDIMSKMIINNKKYLVSYLYYCVLDIKELLYLFKKMLRKIKVINLYNNKVDKKQV